MTALFALLAGICLLPWAREALRRPVSRMRRDAGAIELATLPQGATRYRWFGTEGNPVVVTVHGLTSPSDIFDPLALTLAQHGFRVLSYDLLGRGLSDTPTEAQTAEHFLRHLEDLLADLQITGRVILVGYSMGGVIASLFSAQNPERVGGLVLLASAGFGLTPTRFWRFARDWRGIGDALALAVGDLDLRTAVAPSGDLRAAQVMQLARRGYLGAVLSSLRGALSESIETEHRQIARHQIPTLAIWGGADAVIPATAAGNLARWNRHADQDVLPSADHTLPASHPEQIAQLILAFHSRRIG